MNYWFELKYTLRLLRKKQGFAAISIFVIAVGIAITIPLASVSKFFGFTDLPLANGDRLVALKQRIEGRGNVPVVDAYSYEYIRDNAESYALLTAFEQKSAVFSDGEAAESFSGAWIEPQFLSYASETPLAGRSLLESDSLPGAEPVAVIGFDLWQSYYAGDENVIGNTSRINGENVTVVGIMPQGFGFPYAHDLWLPLQLPGNPEPGPQRSLYLAGLLHENTDRGQALAELDTSLQALATEYPQFYSGASGIILPYTLVMINDGPVYGQLFLGMLATVLALVCFNVGNLLAARNSERLNELAVRGAVGGTRWKIIRQVLLESFLICIIAATTGLAIGSIGLSIISNGIGNAVFSVPYWIDFSLSGSDLLTLAAITTAVWLLSGLYPAWKISNQDINTILGSDSKSSTDLGSGNLTKTLVIVEIIVSCFLLIVCLSTIAAFYYSSQQDMGVNPEGMLTARVDLSSSNYESVDSKQNYLRSLRGELLSSTSIEDVTFATAMAGQNPRRLDFSLEDIDVATDSRLPQVGLAWTDEDYLRLMETELIQGRLFDFADSASSLPVVIVDEFFAERYWPGESALGKRMQIAPEQGGELLTIVGVINHIIQGQPTAERLYQSTVYRPLGQLALDTTGAAAVNAVSLAMQVTDLDTASLTDLEQEVKAAAARVDRDVPVSEVMPMSQMMYLGMEANQFFFDIMLWMALATLALAIVGIYGVVSRSVLSRAMEIGVRRALGSTNFRIISIFLKQGSLYLLFGLMIGGVSGVLVIDLLLQAVGSQDGVSYTFFYIIATVVLMLSLMVFVAAYLPARKLIAFEPAEALHYE